MAICPICRGNTDTFDTGNELTHGVHCPVCGKFRIGEPSRNALSRIDREDRRLAGLSAHIRQANIAGGVPTIQADSWEQLADGHLHTPVNAKLRRLLEYVHKRSEHLGAKVQVHGAKDYPLFDAAAAEVRYLIEALVTRGDLAPANADRYVITPQGLSTLEPSGGQGAPNSCFVAMSFESALDSAYESGIRPAVVACGFADVRLDRVEHANNINDEILSGIRRAKFVVADFTFHSPGVYFEAGFGLGLGKLVIWTCRQDEFRGKAHFDTRPYSHILWKDEAELAKKLSNRIRALVPGAVLD